ncbi:J domain-containing protein [Sphingosinicella soli]|uniref:J domain-containing protein n=1 Tax=Sphingosinicella soli TaxID=333708 RepID=A0A7W7B0Q4_9SPHN|nr:molecular chaperone DnaJ [Sphingosinicella soli]MBB4631900.1 hypothetical protein [Sphingosinicella soli]
MIVVLALAAGALGALWYAGALTPARLRWIGLAAAATLALRLLMTGQWLGALAVAGVTAWLALDRLPRRRSSDMSPQEAGRLLGLSPEAGAVEINAAWRRLITEAHPDKGGSAEASARINAARDTLLKHLRDTKR